MKARQVESWHVVVYVKNKLNFLVFGRKKFEQKTYNSSCTVDMAGFGLKVVSSEIDRAESDINR